MEVLTIVSYQHAMGRKRGFMKKISHLPDGSQHSLRSSKRSSAKNDILAVSSFKNAWEIKKANQTKNQKQSGTINS
jgi:hypothetical protein